MELDDLLHPCVQDLLKVMGEIHQECEDADIDIGQWKKISATTADKYVRRAESLKKTNNNSMFVIRTNVNGFWNDYILDEDFFDYFYGVYKAVKDTEYIKNDRGASSN